MAASATLGARSSTYERSVVLDRNNSTRRLDSSLHRNEGPLRKTVINSNTKCGTE